LPIDIRDAIDGEGQGMAVLINDLVSVVDEAVAEAVTVQLYADDVTHVFFSEIQRLSETSIWLDELCA
jgi:hypothetical protein